jgi:hypothetical protein
LLPFSCFFLFGSSFGVFLDCFWLLFFFGKHLSLLNLLLRFEIKNWNEEQCCEEGIHKLPGEEMLKA